MSLLLALLAVVPAPQNQKPPPKADDSQETRFHRVHLNNGNFVDGDLINQTAFEVNLRVKTGSMSIPRELIDRVELVKMRRAQEEPTPIAKPQAPPRPVVVPAPPPARAASNAPVKAASQPHTPSPAVRAQVDALLSRLRQAAPEGVDGILREISEVEGDTTSYVAALMETGPAPLAETLGPVLAQRPDPAAIPYLLRLFAHAAPAIRTHAVAGLAAVGARGQLPDLAALGKDPSPEVRAAAVTAIQDVKTEEGFTTLLSFAADLDGDVRTRALDGLAQLAGDLQLGERLSEALLGLLTTSGTEARPDVLRTIGRLRNPALATRILGHLKANEAAERAAAANALGEIGSAEAAEAVVSRMEAENNEEVQIALATAAVRVKAKESVPVLIGWLGESDEAVKRAALTALRSFSGKDFKEDVDQWTAWWEKSKS